MFRTTPLDDQLPSWVLVRSGRFESDAPYPIFVRSHVFKVVFFLHRRTDLSAAEFVAHSKTIHIPLVSRVPGLIRYVVNHAVANPMGAVAACDSVAELWFESMETFQGALTTEEGKAALADQPNYLDMTRTHMLIVDEQVVR